MILWIFPDWPGFIQAFVLIVGVLVALWEIASNRKTNEIRLLHEFSNEERKLSFKLFEIGKSIDREKSETTVEGLLRRLEEEAELLIYQHLNFLETISLFVLYVCLDGYKPSQYKTT